MTRLAIVVEGRTETEFVDKVLTPYLWGRGVYPFSNSLDGHVSVRRLAGRMTGFLRSTDRVTSLVDFYGFQRRNVTTPDELETRIDEEISGMTTGSWHQRAFSYVQQYEFEALLFSDVNAFARLPGVSTRAIDDLSAILARPEFRTPEDINDNPDAAPSKRIAQVIHRYDKVGYGYLIAEEIGLDTIRAECPRFNGWLTRLESLGAVSGTT